MSNRNDLLQEQINKTELALILARAKQAAGESDETAFEEYDDEMLKLLKIAIGVDNGSHDS